MKKLLTICTVAALGFMYLIYKNKAPESNGNGANQGIATSHVDSAEVVSSTLPEKIAEPDAPLSSNLIAHRPAKTEQIDSIITPAETQLLYKDGISLNAQRNVLETGNFSNYLLALKDQTKRDIDAQDLTSSYRSIMEKALLEGEKGVVSDFACGTSFCAGSINLRGTKGSPDMRTLFGDRNPPMYGITGKSFDLNESSYEYRFIFSADPRFRKLYLRPR